MKEVRKTAVAALAVLFAGALCFFGIQAHALGPEDNGGEPLQGGKDAVIAPHEEQFDMDEGNQQNPEEDNYDNEEDDSGKDNILRQGLTPADDSGY